MIASIIYEAYRSSITVQAFFLTAPQLALYSPASFGVAIPCPAKLPVISRPLPTICPPSPLSSSSMSHCYTSLVCDSLHKPDLRSVFPDHSTLSPSETKTLRTVYPHCLPHIYRAYECSRDCFPGLLMNKLHYSGFKSLTMNFKPTESEF